MPELITLVRGKDDTAVVGYAIVDAEDAPRLRQYRWHLNVFGYAVRRLPRPARRNLLMHRELLGLESGDLRLGDHINQCKIDNRRANLRIVDRVQHNHNMPAHRDGASPYRGVAWHAEKAKWRAYASLNRKWHHLGYFDTEAEAAVASASWRREHMTHATEGLAL